MQALVFETLEELELHPVQLNIAEAIREVFETLPAECCEILWNDGKSESEDTDFENGHCLTIRPCNPRATAISVYFWRKADEAGMPPGSVICAGKDFSYDVIDWEYYSLKRDPDETGVTSRIIRGFVDGQYEEKLHYSGNSMRKSSHRIDVGERPFRTSHIYGFGLRFWSRRVETVRYAPFIE